MLIASIVIAFLLSPFDNQSPLCGDFPFKRLMEGTPRSLNEYRGRYVNLPYEYAVIIPAGLTAYDGRDQDNHHGFGIPLDKQSQSYLFVEGEHNSAEYNTPSEAARKKIEYLRQDGAQVESETITASHLGRLQAVRLEVIYTCPKSKERYIQSSIIALSPGKGLLYTIELYSPVARYEKDQAALNQIIKSWKIIPEPRQRRHRKLRQLKASKAGAW